MTEILKPLSNSFYSYIASLEAQAASVVGDENPGIHPSERKYIIEIREANSGASHKYDIGNSFSTTGFKDDVGCRGVVVSSPFFLDYQSNGT